MRAAMLLVITFGCGCDQSGWLTAHGAASICADNLGLSEAATSAVAYWNDAGLIGLHPCAQGSIEIQMDKLPIVTSGEAYVAYTIPPCKGNPPEIYIEPSVVQQAHDTDTHVRSVAAEIFAHELGHAMGLIHNNDPDSIMYPGSHELANSAGQFDRELAQSLL